MFILVVWFLSVTASPVPLGGGSCSDNWFEGTPVNGVGGWVNAYAMDGEGNVYVGGRFQTAGGVIVNNIAKWDGSSWSALGTGTNNEVRGIAILGTDVYIGGFFTSAGGISAHKVAKWNGSSWSAVGSYPGENVYDINLSGTTLYAGGGIWNPDIQSFEGSISAWDGTTWSTVGSNIDGAVWSIEASGTDVYAAGNFSTIGGVPANAVAKWNGSGWSNLGSGLDLYLQDLAVHGTDIYAAGISHVGNGTSVGTVKKWNGSGWTALGSPMTNPGPGSYAAVYSIAVSGSDVYAGGQFAAAGGTPARGIAKWNGSGWLAVGSWASAYVPRLAVLGGDLFASGYFDSPAGTRRADGIARWNGSAWSALGSGVYNAPTVLAAAGTEVYGAGYFTTDGGTTVNRVAKWNGSGWTPLGPWPNGPKGTVPVIYAITVSGTNVYVGGRWNDSSINFNRGFVRKWDGAAWTDLGSGMTTPTFPDAVWGAVFALAVSGSEVYAGGDFTAAGGIPASRIAKWTGTSWSPLGTGTNRSVRTLSISGDELFAGGEFTTAGGLPANSIAKWNGIAWSAIGDGPISFRPSSPSSGFRAVIDMAIAGPDIYAAGAWDFSDYEDFGFVAKWDGSDWSRYPFTSCCSVNAIESIGPDLYIGGEIPDGVVKWNGNGWSALGGGVNDIVSSMVMTGNQVFVAGSFTTAGCHVSANFARYSSAPVSEVSVSGRVTTTGGRGIGNARVTITDPSGISRLTITSAFGYFRFDNVTVGQSYSVSVRSKRYLFEPRSIQVSEELTNVNFIPQ